MRAAFGRERDARRGRRDDEPRFLIAGVVQRIEAAAHERIVERADGQQPLAKQRVGQAQRRQHQEQVHLGNAELEVLAFRTHLPFLR